MADPTVGVAVMAYGTPASPDDVEPYYTHIRRGRPPTDEQLTNLRARYDALGGVSSLARRTAAQLDALQSSLDRLAPGRFRCVLGQKHASPFVEDGVDALLADGIADIRGIVLAPHYSGFSVGEYHRRAREQAEAGGASYAAVDQWHLEAAYVGFLAAAVSDALTPMPERTRVVFTAHSLPERLLVDDPYVDQLTASAAAAATGAGLGDHQWSTGWQSAGATPEPWRGPDILEIIDDLAADDAVDGVLVCPQGFVSDHLEVAYDLDIEAAARAETAGIAFARTRVLNDDAPTFEALARLVHDLS